jgi:hypothetical protein
VTDFPPPEPEQQQYQTDLAQTPFPEILVKVHHYKVPGRLDCRGGEQAKSIYLEDGEIVFASTNQTDESLGDRLLAAGRITRQQYDDSLRQSRTSGHRHGLTLVEMNILTGDELFVAVREQIEEIVWSIFSWDRGTVAFTPGRDKHQEFVKVRVSIPHAVLRGVRRMPDARALLARIGTKATILEPSELRPEFALSAEEQAMFDAVDGRRTLIDLVNLSPGNPSDNARLLYGLFVLGLIQPKERRRIKVQIKSKFTDQ